MKTKGGSLFTYDLLHVIADKKLVKYGMMCSTGGILK